MISTANLNVIGALAFVAVGTAAAALQAWLWRFPMVPDPTGADPHGVSTAPRLGNQVHRALGYAFLLIYLACLVRMAPRVWAFDEEAWRTSAIAHAALGLALGPLLVAKVLVIRRYRRFGHRLPLFGGALLAGSVALTGLAVAPWLAVLPPGEPGATSSVRSAVGNGCVRCHGLSVVARGPHEHDWARTIAEMREKAFEARIADPTNGQPEGIADYLRGRFPEPRTRSRRDRVSRHGEDGERDDD